LGPIVPDITDTLPPDIPGQGVRPGWCTRSDAPALMPIFRSRRQAEVLALLFLPPTAELTLTEGTTQTYDGTPDSRSGTRGAAL